MKTIKTDSLVTLKKRSLKSSARLYTIHLGDGQFIEFKRLDVAKQFESNVIKIADDFIRSANIVQADLFNIYRRVWPSMDPKQSDLLNTMFVDVLGDLERVYKINDSRAFTQVYNIYLKLMKILNTLDNLLKRKRMYTELYSLITTKGGLEAASLRIKIFKSQLPE